MGWIAIAACVAAFSGTAGFLSSVRSMSVTSIPTPKYQLPTPIHPSGFQGKDFFDNAYKKASTTLQTLPTLPTLPTTPRSAISAHHLLVADKIAALFSSIGSDDVKTVVLISPNHFDAGRSAAQASRGTWETPYGLVESDAGAVDRLVAAFPKLSVEERTFEREHGVGALTPFVARSFPRAKLVPLVLHDTLSEADALALGAAIARDLPDATVVASIDMSHYLPQAVQQFHDDTALRALATGADMDLEIDANRVLDVLRFVNRERGDDAWHLTHHGSSLAMGAATVFADNTSHILGYFTPGEPANDQFVAIHLVGDVMLDRGVRQKMEEHGAGWPWKKAGRFLSGSSLVVGNLEGTVGDRTSVAASEPPFRFTFSSDAITEAARHLDFVSLANNHSKDFHDAGEEETRYLLDGMGLKWFGSWSAPFPTYVSDGVAFIGYHQFKPDEAALVEVIRLHKEAGHFVLVFPHWGTEYQTTPDANQRRLAQLMADAGADAIIGSHPHVIQTLELLTPNSLNDPNRPNSPLPVPTIYSLGNFIFDQGFGDTRYGLTIGMTIDEKTVTLRLIPVATNGGQPAPLEDAQTQTVLDAMADRSPEPLRDQIRSGVITINR